MFTKGKKYNRRDLHLKYGGQKQGGISTPANYDIIMIFTGKQGAQYGYKDGWSEDGKFNYTGEGQVGDMTFVRGNKAIRNHINNGKEVHLFEYVERGVVRYIGQMVYSGYEERKAPDREDHIRKVIVFSFAEKV